MRGKDGRLMVTFSSPKIFHYFELYFSDRFRVLGGRSTEPFSREYPLVRAPLEVSSIVDFAPACPHLG
jgi:hypothetical protein